MKVIIYGKKKETEKLANKSRLILEDLGLEQFIKIEETEKSEFRDELNIKKEPALVIEEESIDFKDIIFEGIIPEDEELKSMFISIIGGGDTGSCSSGSCGDCSSGC